jgi:hypothetical protein
MKKNNIIGTRINADDYPELCENLKITYKSIDITCTVLDITLHAYQILELLNKEVSKQELKFEGSESYIGKPKIYDRVLTPEEMEEQRKEFWSEGKE